MSASNVTCLDSYLVWNTEACHRTISNCWMWWDFSYHWWSIFKMHNNSIQLRFQKNQHEGGKEGIMWWLTMHCVSNARNPADSQGQQKRVWTWVVLTIILWLVKGWINSLVKFSKKSHSSKNLNKVRFTLKYMCHR